jgi:hypothetical protein
MKLFLMTRRSCFYLLCVGGAIRSTPLFASASKPSTSYPTQIPPAFVLTYRMRKGSWSGRGELRWQPSGGHYQAHLEGRVMGMRVLGWHSEGLLDSSVGIVPLRFTDQRRGKPVQQAIFERSVGRITYQDASEPIALVSGTQDRLSWMLQIAAIANASPKHLVAGGTISFWVSGAKGDADVWTFDSQGLSPLNTSMGTIQAVKLLRESRKPNDTRVEVWLDPAYYYAPIRAKLANSEGGDALELVLESRT